MIIDKLHIISVFTHYYIWVGKGSSGGLGDEAFP